ncbi:MAG: hypothetical protein WB392_14320 [Methanotrichaceae archaeon]
MCSTVCEAGISTVDLWEAVRPNLVACGAGPYGKQSAFPKLLGKDRNPYMAKQEDRLYWVPKDIKIPDLALDMAKARVVDVECTGSQIVASTCPFCRRNLMDGRTAAESKIKVVDVVELMAQAMGLDTTIPENPYSKYQEQDVITCSAPEAALEAVKKAVVVAAK